MICRLRGLVCKRTANKKGGANAQYLWNGRGQTGPGVMVEPLHLVCASVSLCVFYSLWNEDGGKVMRGGGQEWGHTIINPLSTLQTQTHAHTHTRCLSWAWDNRVKGPWVLGVIGRGPGSQGTHGRDKEALDSIKHEQGWTYIRPHGKHHNSTPFSAQSTPSVTEGEGYSYKGREVAEGNSNDLVVSRLCCPTGFISKGL